MWAILEEISGQPTWKISKQKNIKNVNGVGKVMRKTLYKCKSVTGT